MRARSMVGLDHVASVVRSAGCMDGGAQCGPEKSQECVDAAALRGECLASRFARNQTSFRQFYASGSNEMFLVALALVITSHESCQGRGVTRVVPMKRCY